MFPFNNLVSSYDTLLRNNTFKSTDYVVFQRLIIS